MNTLSLFIFFILLATSTFGQDAPDLPSTLNYFTEDTRNIWYQTCNGTEKKHRVVISQHTGQEFTATAI